jgi:hypothetical protein
VQVFDSDNKPHTLHVQVLGTEETWHTPSLLLAAVSGGDGKVVFSQVHLEVDPTQYEDEESKFAALKESNTARLEIIQDLLSTHLGLECANNQNLPSYTPGYFLGRHEVGTLVLLTFHFLSIHIVRPYLSFLSFSHSVLLYLHFFMILFICKARPASACILTSPLPPSFFKYLKKFYLFSLMM